MNGCMEAYALLKELAFERTGGTDEELRAAEILRFTANSYGVLAEIENFEVHDSENMVATLKVIEPYEKEYTITAYKCCADTSPQGLEADFIYVEDGEDANLVGVEGKIVLVNGYMRLPLYKKLVEAKVAGFITMSGTLLDKEGETDLFTRKIRSQLQTFGVVPAANIRVSDAAEMVAKEASRVCLRVENVEKILTSRNVTARIEGTRYSEQIISFGAHYDSTEFSKGVYDNASGCVLLMELLRHFKDNPPKRTIVFNWYGSEEMGLLGSKAFVSSHADEMDKHIFMVNVDVAGPILGKNVCRITGSKELTAFADMYMKSKGYAMKVVQAILSSDSIPFADVGIPSVNFSREGADGAAYIHCRNDDLFFCSRRSLENLLQPLLDFSELLINSSVFPEKKEIPKEIKEKVDNYLYKKELEIETEKKTE